MNIHTRKANSFTLLELMVAVSLMTLLSLFLGTVFSVCSSAMTRTRNNVEACGMANFAFNVMEKDFLAAFRYDTEDFLFDDSGGANEITFATMNTISAKNRGRPLIVTYRQMPPSGTENLVYIKRKAELLPTGLDENPVEGEDVYLLAGRFDGTANDNKCMKSDFSTVTDSETPRFVKVCIAVDIDSDGTASDPDDKIIRRIFAVRSGD